MQLRAFRALRPVPELAARIVSLPYDVVSLSEAAALAAGEPMSFLHVGRSDIDLPEDVDPHDPGRGLFGGLSGSKSGVRSAQARSGRGSR
jgi:uncharacterized protein (DUF1015 family)